MPLDGNLRDLSGNGSHGLMAGSGSYAAARHGRCVYFPGGGAKVSCVSPKRPLGNSPRTTAVWFKTTNAHAGIGALLSYGASTAARLCWLLLVYNTKLVFGTGYSADELTSTAVVSDGLWHHALVSYDGTFITLYLDGRQIGQVSDTIVNTGSTYTIAMGQTEWGSYSYTGSISDVKVFNYALSRHQVAMEYNQLAKDKANV